MITEAYWRDRPVALEHDGGRLQSLILMKRPLGPDRDPEPDWLAWLRVQLSAGVQAESLSWMLPHLNWQGCSDFRRQVYHCLREQVPAGQVISYSQLAARCGRPKAARSVAAALSRNPFPIIVPCHRVLPASGRLGGFMGERRDGSGWKRALLTPELPTVPAP